MCTFRSVLSAAAIAGLFLLSTRGFSSAEEQVSATEPAVIHAQQIVSEVATERTASRQTVKAVAAVATKGSAAEPAPRNVILMIGDGMGPQQLSMLFAYAHHVAPPDASASPSAIEALASAGNVGLVRTNPHGAIVVDSAAAATQLATGQPAGSEMIGVDYAGNPATTVVEVARDLGKSTGLVSDTRMTHATPAAFGAHQRSREMENEIAEDLLANRIDVLLSGGLRNWVPQAVNDKNSAAYLALMQMMGGVYDPYSRRTDNRNLLVEARSEYKLVFDRNSLAGVERGPVLGLFANSEMLDAIGENKANAAGNNSEPTLVEMTEKALQLLSQDEDGFFLMVEGGQIDWAGHNNDAGDMLHELVQFDAAIRAVFQWASERDDTLVVVTADHETGSFGFSYSAHDLPAPQSLPGTAFGEELFTPNFNYGPQEQLTALAAQKKSFYEIFTEFDALPAKEQTAERLMEIVNAAVAPYSITLADATKLLTRAPNRFYQKQHPYLGSKTVPAMPDQEAFFVYGENLRMNRLGHILGEQQNVVWGTGTHTATPVPIISCGPHAEKFAGFLHATDVGSRLIDAVRGQ